MIKVYQSDTGQFVLVHGPSQSFIIENSLEAGYAKLEEHLKAHHPEMVGKVLEPVDKPADHSNSRIAQLVLIVFLALLPFVWLLVLNHSLATLLTDVQFGGDPGVEAIDYEYLREDVDMLRLEQNRLLQAVHSLSQSVEALAVKHEALDQMPDGATVIQDPEAATEAEEASDETDEMPEESPEEAANEANEESDEAPAE